MLTLFLFSCILHLLDKQLEITMWNTIYKKVDNDWYVSVTHFVYGEGIQNQYSVFIKYKNNNWLWNDVKYCRNQLNIEIIKMKKSILLNKRIKPCRMFKSR